VSAFEPEFIIIGSGPAGVSAAVPLVAAGRRVLMLDGASAAAETAPRARWERSLGSQLQSLRPDGGTSPKLQSPLARDLIGGFLEASGIRGENFVAVGSLGRGGLSRVWGGQLSLLDDEDLEGWPIRHADLAPSYRAVMARIGVSTTGGDEAGMAALPAGAIASHVLARHRRSGRVADFALWPAQNAVLAAPAGDRQGCDLRGDCLFGCERGAIYSSVHDLPLLQKSPFFALAEAAYVTDLRPLEGGGWTVGTADGRRFSAPRVLLAAGVLGSAALLSHVITFPPEGLRVLNSPALALPLILPERLFRRPEATHSLAQLGFALRYGHARLDYLTGGFYEVNTLPASSFINRMPAGRRGGRALFDLLASSLAVATAYFQGEESRTFLRVEETPAGRELVVRGGFAEGLEERAQVVLRRLATHWRRLGLFRLPGAAIATPGTDAHFAGTFPMGGWGNLSTTDLGELSGFSGLHLIDGSILPTLPSKYITLTVMANADRIARRLSAG
jgi:choline dehydrogenase-like flavoprotein